jgi:hypothetical protein
MSLKDFIAATRLMGIAKPNRFTVYFQAPNTLANAGPFAPNAMQNIALYCNRATLPGISVSTTPIRTTGEVMNVAYDRNFEPCTLTFYADIGMNAKFFFEEWINSIQDRDDRTFAYYDDYTIPKMVIDVETVNNQPAYRVELYKAYPKSVSDVVLDYANNGLMEISVTFEYRYWKSKQLNEGSETPYSRDNTGSIGDTFLNMQGGLSLGLGNFSKQGGILGQVTLGTSVLSGLINTGQQSFNTLANSIGNLNNLIPSNMSTPGIVSSISGMVGQATGYASQTGNMGIQLSTPAGINISPTTLTSIGGMLGNINTSIGPAGPISQSIAAFAPTSTAAIVSQLGTMGTQLNSVGQNLGIANSAINSGILVSALGTNGVAPNAPRG